MSLFDRIFGNRPKVNEKDYQGTFKMLNGYTPRFTSHRGGVYESQMVRAAIHARATHVSKLKVEMMGSARPALQSKMKHGPNQFQTWSQFMYRLSSILDVFNTAFIVPVYDEFGEPSGIYTPLPRECEILQYKGEPWLRYKFNRSEYASEPLEYCGIMTKFQMKHDFFGESNAALDRTMDLIEIQNQGIEEGVKSAAGWKFIARVNNLTKGSDLALERQRFTEENLSREAKGGGLLLFPNTYTDIKQVDVKPWVVDADQMRIINENVYDYFGVNEAILQNRASADELDSFFNGAIEPFMIQLSEVMTKMFFTLREQSMGNEVVISANRLQYMSVTQKVEMSRQLGDRGAMMIDEIRELFNLPPLPDGNGQHAPIRGEYYYAGEDQNDTGETEEE